MILQALYEYYQRKSEDASSGIAPIGWEWKEMPFLLWIDHDGNFIKFEDTRENVGRFKRAKSFLVPSLGRKKEMVLRQTWDGKILVIFLVWL